MKERKQSFLERLTGTQVVDDAAAEKDRETNVLSEKPWSSRFDGDGGARKKFAPAQEPEEVESEPEEEHEEEPEDDADDDDNEDAGLAIDMYESDNELIVQCMIAGVTPENLHISITREKVTIKGRRVAPEGIDEEHYIERELYWGTFSREIELPFEIDTDGAEAVEKYGLLVIRLPKINTKKSQELKVRSVE